MSSNETTTAHETGADEDLELELQATVAAAAAQVTIETTSEPKAKSGAPSTVAMLERQLERKIDEEQLPVLGALVWWAFSGTEITVDDFKKLVEAAGLDKGLVPEPEPRGALADALAALKLSKVKVIRHKIDDKRFAMSLHTSHVEDDGGATVKAEAETIQVVEFSHETGALSFRNDYMRQEIQDGFTKYRHTLGAGDIKTLVLRSLKNSNAITAREAGGVYFVPRPALDVVSKLRALCSAIPGASFSRLRIADEPEERADMLKTAGAEIEAELAAAEKDLAEIEEKLKNKKPDEASPVRSGTLERRIKTFQEIQAKALAYKDLLDFKSEDVTAKLDSLKGKVELFLELA